MKISFKNDYYSLFDLIVNCKYWHELFYSSKLQRDLSSRIEIKYAEYERMQKKAVKYEIIRVLLYFLPTKGRVIPQFPREFTGEW